MRLKTVKTSIEVLICPRCGYEHEEEIMGEGIPPKWLCYNCEYDFGSIQTTRWTEKKVEGVICDKCKKIVPCISRNFTLFELREVACPFCSPFYPHRIAIFYRGWRPPAEFLKFRGKNGILPVRTTREYITLHVLNLKAKEERTEFRLVKKKTPAKILWVQGKAVGYYTYSYKFGKTRKPCIHQIYVLPEYRKRGFGMQLFKDFLDEFKDREILIESPNEATGNLLLKLGLVEKTKKGYKSTGKVAFVSV